VKAVLLAAGLGTRLRPITQTVPKCLVPIRGRPLLDYWLEHLFGQGIVDEVRINTHYLADRVRAHVAQSPWRDCWAPEAPSWRAANGWEGLPSSLRMPTT